LHPVEKGFEIELIGEIAEWSISAQKAKPPAPRGRRS